MGSDTYGIATKPPMDNGKGLYEYHVLEPETKRLVKITQDSSRSCIRCTLGHSPLASSDYVALSYCWGDPKPTAIVYIDDRRFRIAQNLYSFLQFATEKKPSQDCYFWIDAICINQSDSDEKSRQVHNMWRIYQQATTVLSWLGDEQDFTAAAFRAVNEIGDQAKQHKAGGLGRALESEDFPRPGLDAIQAVVSLTENPYFQRMWIVQEMLNARSLYLLSGDFRCEAYSLGVFISALESMRDEGSEFPEVDRNASNVFFEYMILESSDHIRGPDRVNALSDAVGDTRRRQCSDQRDKIFALLGLPTIRAIDTVASIKPDYSMSVEEVFVAAVSWYDALWAEQGLRPDPLALTEAVSDLAYTLAIEVLERPFRSWLQQRVHKPPGRDTEIIQLESGREIDCSGETLQDLLQDGPMSQALIHYEPIN